jgi:hypothetical protein
VVLSSYVTNWTHCPRNQSAFFPIGCPFEEKKYHALLSGWEKHYTNREKTLLRFRKKALADVMYWQLNSFNKITSTFLSTSKYNPVLHAILTCYFRCLFVSTCLVTQRHLKCFFGKSLVEMSCEDQTHSFSFEPMIIFHYPLKG